VPCHIKRLNMPIAYVIEVWKTKNWSNYLNAIKIKDMFETSIIK